MSEWMPFVREVGALGVLLFTLWRLDRTVAKLAAVVHHIAGKIGLNPEEREKGT